ncbi:MAG: hypothetical protein M1826_007559 [Phylliscum demangeonii]|nr:MAG: hypothetical protein M1826_007559 [Phylliscum demangeonii]
MKSWTACAVALVHLTGPIWALPRTPARLPSQTNNDNDNGQGVHVSTAEALLGGSALLVGGVAAGAALRQRQVHQLQRENEEGQDQIHELLQHRVSMAQKMEPPDIIIIRLETGSPDTVHVWKVPPKLLGDGVMMECIYEHCQVQVDGHRFMDVRAFSSAIRECAKYHDRSLQESWFDELRPAGDVWLRRSSKRSTAWAEQLGKGKEAAQAAQLERTYERFSIQPLAGMGMIPHWAKQLGTSAKRTVAALAAGARHFPAYHSPLLQKEAPLLRKGEAGLAAY